MAEWLGRSLSPRDTAIDSVKSKNGPVAEWLGRSLSPRDTAIQIVKSKKGPVAEWLGRSLQNFVQRFKSARDLQFLFIRRH